MFHSSKCTLYQEIKCKFGLEFYLYKLQKNVWKYIVKFRCSDYKLFIETGRYAGCFIWCTQRYFSGHYKQHKFRSKQCGDCRDFIKNETDVQIHAQLHK